MDERKHGALKLVEQFCFYSYAVSREIIKRYKPILDEIGLTYTQYLTMIVLWEQETLTVKELGGYLYLDSGTLTPLLKKLEEKGLVTRRRSAEDERNLVVALTDEGRKLHEVAAAIPGKYRELYRLSPDDLKAYQLSTQEFLQKLKEDGI